MHDYKNFRYITNANKSIELNYTENEILNILISEKGNIVTYKYLCKHLFNSSNINIYKGILATTICRLRKKLKGEINIVTRIKIGYIIR